MRGILLFLFLASRAFSAGLPGIAFYEGNTDLGQLVNTIDGTNALTENGTVENNSTPAPVPNGDLWLGGNFSTVNFFTLPNAAVPPEDSFLIAWYYGAVTPDETTEEFFNIVNSGTTRYIVIKVLQNMKASWDYTNSAGTNQNQDSAAAAFVNGTTHVCRLESRSTGVTFKVDGVIQLGTDTDVLDYGTVDNSAIGYRTGLGSRSLEGNIDAFYISSDPDAAFPPTSKDLSPFLKNSIRNRIGPTRLMFPLLFFISKPSYAMQSEGARSSQIPFSNALQENSRVQRARVTFTPTPNRTAVARLTATPTPTRN